VLDARADDVPIGDRNDVRDSISSVDNCPRQRTLFHLLRGPTGGEGEHSLHCDIQALDVEGLEHDLGGQLAILRRIHRRLSQQKIVLLWV